MAVAEWEYFARSSRLKSGRRRKRLQKKENDKQLIRLHKERKELSVRQHALGYLELDPPVQKGWERTFTEEKQEGVEDNPFFGFILEKINTVTYSSRKDFTVKKKKQGKKIRVETHQQLKELHECEFNRLCLDERQKLFFRKEYRYIGNSTVLDERYVFTEPWRFVLRIRPRMVTKVKVIDPLICKREKEIENYLQRNNLGPRLWKILDGYYQYFRSPKDKPGYLQKLKMMDREIREISFNQ